VSSRDTLVRNTFWHGLVTLIGLGCGVLMSVILARGLGPARMGEFSYILWAQRTLFALAQLGFAVATIRYTASALAQGDAALAWGCVALMRRRQIITTTIVTIATIPVVFLLAPPALTWPFVVICLGLFPMTIEYIYSHAVFGANRYDLTTQTSTVKMTVQLSATVLVLWLGFGILGLVVGNILGAVIAMMIQRQRAQSIYPARATAVPESMRGEMRAYLVPLSVVSVLDALVWDRSEVFFLGLWSDSHQIAFYSLAFGLATKAMILPEIAIGALLPTFAALHGRGAIEEFRQVYQTALRNVMLVGVPLAAVTTALAPGIVAFLYGDEYRPVAALLSVMIIVAVFASMRKVGWAALRGLGDRRGAITATSVAAVINIGAAVLLIAPWGTWGAVAANTLAQLVATVWAFFVLSRVHGCRLPFFDLARLTAAGVVSLVATLMVAPDGGDLVRIVLGGVVGFAMYLAAAVALRVIGPNEWRFLMTSLRYLARRTPSSPAVATSTAPAPKPAATEVV
jgi:O-antigen/teichoic acid export membrane protein